MSNLDKRLDRLEMIGDAQRPAIAWLHTGETKEQARARWLADVCHLGIGPGAARQRRSLNDGRHRCSRLLNGAWFQKPDPGNRSRSKCRPLRLQAI